MPIEDFIIIVYCCVTDEWKELTGTKRIRRGGFRPKLTDQEVITIEIIGEFLGLENDKRILEYFKRNWSKWFPIIGSRRYVPKNIRDSKLDTSHVTPVRLV